jgi:hypothetical protein
VGNSVHVQTLAQLLTALAAGQSVQVAPGEYVATSDIMVPSNVTIQCDSLAAHFTMPGVQGTHNIFNISNASNVEIIGCNIDGTGMLSTGKNSFTVYDPNSTNVEFSGNWIHDSPEDCLRLGPNGPGTDTPQHTRIVNNRFDNCGSHGPSGSFIGVQSGIDVVITGNTGTKSILDGVDVEPATVIANQPGAHGDDITISGNVLDGGGIGQGNCIALFIPTVNSGLTGSGQNASVSGNTCKGYPGGSAYIVHGPWRNVSIDGGTGIDSVYGLRIEATNDYSTVTVNTAGCSARGNVATLLGTNAFSLSDLVFAQGFTGKCSPLNNVQFVITSRTATEITGNLETSVGTIPPSSDSGIMSRFATGPIIVQGLELDSNGTGISSLGVGANNNTINAVVTNSGVGVSEGSGANGNTYTLDFKGNTNNIGPMGNLSTVVSNGDGSIDNYLFSNTSGQNSGEFLNYDGSTLAFFPGTLTQGDYTPYSQTGDYGIGCLTATCSLDIGNKSHTLRMDGTTGLWSADTLPLPVAPKATTANGLATYGNANGTALADSGVTLLGAGTKLGTIQQGVATVPPTVATPLLTLPNVPMGMWMVCAGYDGSGDVSSYNSCGMVATSNSSAKYSAVMSGSALTLSVSGLSVMATQTSGTAIPITYSALQMF